jgi:uncharacterized membrane protein
MISAMAGQAVASWQDDYGCSMIDYDVVGPLHIAASAVALWAGGLVAVARKGTAYHRRIGWVFVAAMALVNVTALLVYRLTGAVTPFHVAAVFSLATVIAGVVPVRRKSPPRFWLWRHATWMAGSYVGLWAAAVAETATRLRVFPFWWAVFAATTLTMAVGAVMMSRMIPVSINSLRRPGTDPQ